MKWAGRAVCLASVCVRAIGSGETGDVCLSQPRAADIAPHTVNQTSILAVTGG